MTQARKYYLLQYSAEVYWHGGIGYADMETILQREGYTPLVLPASSPFFIPLPVLRFFQILLLFFKIRKRDELVFIYPVYGRMNRLLLKWLRWKGVNPICIVGDIDGLKDANAIQLYKDITFFRLQKRMIVHNAAMEKWMQDSGCKARMAQLGFFDFLATPATMQRKPGPQITFAGNLAKSPFLLQLQQPELKPLQFLVYGQGLPTHQPLPANLEWKGAFSPRDLPALLEGSFGLLWDGDQWDKPAGSIGHYMPYITHHKLSLYILAGLPILAPKLAGAAPLIEANGMGLLFESLADIEPVIKNLSEESYNQMRENQKALASKIAAGDCLKGALDELKQV